jgi:hypothetical protein
MKRSGLVALAVLLGGLLVPSGHSIRAAAWPEVNGQFLHIVRGELRHTMLIPAQPEAEQRWHLRQIKRTGATWVALCVGFNAGPGDNPFNENHHVIDVRMRRHRQRINHAVSYARTIGLRVAGVVFLDDSRALGVNERLHVINLATRTVGRRIGIWWLALEGDEYLSADLHHRLGRRLAARVVTPVLVHFTSERWSPVAGSRAEQLAWWTAATWCSGLAFQTRVGVEDIGWLLGRIRHRLGEVGSFAVYLGETEPGLPVSEKVARAQEAVAHGARGSFDGLWKRGA